MESVCPVSDSHLFCNDVLPDEHKCFAAWHCILYNKVLFPSQDGPDTERRNRTKQESAWIFRLWYSFDHKYPFQELASNFVMRGCCQRGAVGCLVNPDWSRCDWSIFPRGTQMKEAICGTAPKGVKLWQCASGWLGFLVTKFFPVL